MRWRLAPALGLALSLVVGAAGSSSAAWSVTGAGSSRAQAAVQQPPASVTVTWDPTVHVSWVASSSPFTAGHRVVRSVSPEGPWTAVADVPVTTTTVDDTPGAGTWYYAVRAYRGNWTSTLSGVSARSDPTYVFTTTNGFTGTNCTAAGAGSQDMQQGFSTAGGTGVRRRRSDGSVNFCTDTFTTGQSLRSGTTTVAVWVQNTAGATCDLTATLSVNGTTSLGSGTLTVPSTSALQLRTFTFPTAPAALASGQRVGLVFTWQTVNACNYTWLNWGGPDTPSSVTLTG